MAIVLVNDVQAIGKLIGRAHKAGATFALAVHEAAYNCLMHAGNTGDIRPMQKLYEGLNVNAKRALRVWACEFGKFKYDAQADGLKYATKGETKAAEAEAVGPMEYARPKAPKGKQEFSLKAEIKKLIERAGRNNVSGKPIDLLTNALKAA